MVECLKSINGSKEKINFQIKLYFYNYNIINIV